jgi:hypothetical protein
MTGRRCHLGNRSIDRAFSGEADHHADKPASWFAALDTFTLPGTAGSLNCSTSWAARASANRSDYDSAQL